MLFKKPAPATVHEAARDAYASLTQLNAETGLGNRFRDCVLFKPTGAILNKNNLVFAAELTENSVRGDISVVRRGTPIALLHFKTEGAAPQVHVVVAKTQEKLGNDLVKRLSSLLPARTRIQMALVNEVPHTPLIYKSRKLYPRHNDVRDVLSI